ncbi:MAG TPA: acyl-CoA thioesterase [Chitinophagaceae bacterium]|nr:acyl-CoA thioesterase [Chitinophagaceae bacterium]
MEAIQEFIRPVQVRWSDLDPNFHLRHSVYYDWGAYCRVAYLESIRLDMKRLQELRTGPILFREECIFRKEIKTGDIVTIDMRVQKARRDFSRFTIRHEIRKNGDILSAVLTVDIAWMDVLARKLTALPEEDAQLLQASPLTPDFQWLD